MGVISSGTEEHLSNGQLEDVSKAILKEVLKNTDPGRIAFEGSSKRSGSLQVNCANSDTSE